MEWKRSWEEPGSTQTKRALQKAAQTFQANLTQLEEQFNQPAIPSSASTRYQISDQYFNIEFKVTVSDSQKDSTQ